MSYEDVLDAHFCIADFFDEGYGMGGIGIKDLGVFISTVERQFAGFDGSMLNKTYYEEIASLMYGIIKNHPFYDANKRTAFLCGLTMLYRKGRVITVDQKVFEDLMVEIADGSILKRSALKDKIKVGSAYPEVEYLGRYLEKNSRKKVRLSKTIKFRDLRRMVRMNGFDFINQHKGTIDLVKKEEKEVVRFWFVRDVEKTTRVIANIAYHGEGVDVPDNTSKLVRQNCGMTDEDGFDGEVILRDAQPTFQLINDYRLALQRLAFR